MCEENNKADEESPLCLDGVFAILAILVAIFAFGWGLQTASSGLEQVLNVTNSKVGDMSVGQLIKLTEAIENIAG